MAWGKGEFWEMRREFKTGLETSESTFELPKVITITDEMQYLSGQAGLDLSKKKDFICNSIHWKLFYKTAVKAMVVNLKKKHVRKNR